MTTPSLTPSDAANLFRTPPQRFIDVGAGEVAYRRVGQGPDVLFVHGWPVTSATYRHLLPHLAPHVTCHLFDFPGAGDSRFDRSTHLSIAQHVETVGRVVDALELDSVALVGHDSGGMIARHAMAGDPRLRAMALVNTEQPQGLHWRFKRFLWMAKLTPGFPHVLAWAGMRRTLRKSDLLLGGCFADKRLLDGEFEEFFLEPLKSNRDRRWAAGQLIGNFDTRFVHELGAVHQRIDVPIKLVWGADDPFFPLDWARAMVDTFAQASLEVIEDARLFVHEECPEQVAAAMLQTLTGVEAPVRASA